MFLHWLEAQRTELSPAQRHGAVWLGERLTARKHEAMTGVRNEVVDAFLEIDARLRDRVATLHATWRLDEPSGARPRFGHAVAAIVRDHAADLRARVLAVTSAEDEAGAHATRIAAKRLRYLLEPFAEVDPGARDLVKRMKKLQAVLGDLHDVHVFGHALADANEDAAAEHARRLHALTVEHGADMATLRREQRTSGRAGLLALALRAKTQAERLHADFRSTWVAEGIDAVVAEAEALAARFERRRPIDVEIERKFLLRALPAEAESGLAYLIEQGWLPGRRLRERVRKATGPDGSVAYTRTVKLGEGLTRTELEEPTTAEVFDALWVLTEGCRVRKRRFAVPVNGHTIEIDAFLDRDLFLAEVELDAEDEAVDLPKWLEAVIERDVTGDAAYVNLNLAR